MSTSTTDQRGPSSKRRWVRKLPIVCLVCASVLLLLSVMGVDTVRRGSTTLVIEGRFLKMPSNASVMGGELTVFRDNNCLGISNSEEQFVAVFPLGTRIEGAGEEIRVNGAPVGTMVEFGKRGLNPFEKVSMPVRCRGMDVWIIEDVEPIR